MTSDLETISVNLNLGNVVFSEIGEIMSKFCKFLIRRSFQ